jgi:hypothetical protein
MSFEMFKFCFNMKYFEISFMELGHIISLIFYPFLGAVSQRFKQCVMVSL